MILTLEEVGLVLAPATLLLAASVCWVYRTKLRRPKVPADWLILGIFFGFLGKLLDNAFWSWTWHLHSTGDASFKDFFSVGPAVNVFTRQIPLMISAACHLWAAKLYRSP